MIPCASVQEIVGHLKVAKLAPEVFLTLGKILRNVATKPERKDRKEKQ